jgi:hypothetical protein
VNVTSEFAFAVHAAAGDPAGEQFTVVSGGEELPWAMVPGANGERIALVTAGPGRLDTFYDAKLCDAPLPSPSVSRSDDSFGIDQLVALRQSRYCPSDRLDRVASTTFNAAVDPSALAHQVADWVNARLEYTLGASNGSDGAIETFLTGKGVCRDYAHLTIALCRALGIPARMMSAYAPGLTPMDFHAVAEVWTGSCWEVIDATRLAPRSTLIRIATGRDAADTAFVSVFSGAADLISCETFASTDDDLPNDDHHMAVTIQRPT